MHGGLKSLLFRLQKKGLQNKKNERGELPFNVNLTRFKLRMILSMCLYSFVQIQNLYVKCLNIKNKFLVNDSRTNATSIMNVCIHSTEAESERKLLLQLLSARFVCIVHRIHQLLFKLYLLLGRFIMRPYNSDKHPP